ncbi:MAG TPA: glycosyltransferase [Methylomirabilota bacterium]|jgi:glycosyltransferase involved in cell wall biosynthesis|nr:glycosyltransferase [Methylomirabilota bacterium]
MLSVLTVAYPLAPVGPDAVGGAEQIASALDRALVAAGHRSTLLACAGSTAAGELISTGPLPRRLDESAKRRARSEHARRIDQLLKTRSFDLVHFHGVDAADYLPAPGVPTVITVHLPAHWYPSALFAPRPATVLVAVSQAARRSFPSTGAAVRLIPNGVPDALFSARHAKRAFVLALGRICPEKGFHLALDAARQAELPLLLGGVAHPYPEHEAYFEAEIRPGLDRCRRYIGPLGFRRKRRLLAAARCLAMPSLAPETGALAAIEALACGTPVVAFPNGALAELVSHGRTGFLVNSVEEMAEALRAAASLKPEDCRAAAAPFREQAMAGAYLQLYGEMAAARVHAL